jgi:uncharacterized membrane protein
VSSLFRESHIIAITFDDEHEAGMVRQSLKELQHEDQLHLDDVAIVVKDQNGKVHIHHGADRGVVAGALTGGFLGLFLGMIFFPVAGVVVGAVGGALVGKSADMGVDKQFINEVSAALRPGTSALFVMVRDNDPSLVIDTLKPYRGTLYQTSFDSETEEELKHVLSVKE